MVAVAGLCACGGEKFEKSQEERLYCERRLESAERRAAKLLKERNEARRDNDQRVLDLVKYTSPWYCSHNTVDPLWITVCERSMMACDVLRKELSEKSMSPCTGRRQAAYCFVFGPLSEQRMQCTETRRSCQELITLMEKDYVIRSACHTIK